MIAEILGCKFTLSIIEEESVYETRDITVGELVEMVVPEEEAVLPVVEEVANDAVEEPKDEVQQDQAKEEKEILRQGIKGYFRKGSLETETKEVTGEINPYTRKEYETNSVRMHPKKIGYVQVYDREQHKWTDMTEWAFLGYQERKKQLLGKDYRPPIYLD